MWQRIGDEKIKDIGFCDEDPGIDVDSWYVFEQVSDNQLQGIVKFLGEEMAGVAGAPEGYNYMEHVTCEGWVRITTDKGKYVSPLHAHTPQNNWQERVSLVGLWPKLQKEKIESISFCTDEVGADIDSWDCWNVPREHLDECRRCNAERRSQEFRGGARLAGKDEDRHR
jgi:hypothetical protein